MYNVTKGGEVGGSPGKPTRLPGDPTLYPTVLEAAKALAQRKGISLAAAERRIHAGRIEVKEPVNARQRVLDFVKSAGDWVTVTEIANGTGLKRRTINLAANQLVSAKALDVIKYLNGSNFGSRYRFRTASPLE